MTAEVIDLQRRVNELLSMQIETIEAAMRLPWKCPYCRKQILSSVSVAEHTAVCAEYQASVGGGS